MNCIANKGIRAGLLGLFFLLACGPLSASESQAAGNRDYQQPQLLSPLNLVFPMDVRHIAHGWTTGTVRLRIDTDGRVADWIPIDLPHYKLIPAIDRALADAHFSPAIVDGELAVVDLPAQIPLDEAITYRVISETLIEHIESMQAKISPKQYQVIVSPPSELDQPLDLVSSGNGYQVLDESNRPITGEALISFYIDTRGVPRMIQVENATNPSLIEAAVMTVEELRFTPPTRKRQPTVLRARMPVVFGEVGVGPR
jgi:TonB family protein